ncbi:site-specific tyrosine recombinase XerD [Acetobacteroides hydrogenigenes]|uniref:Tyrosine recombinase XerC n=1 Tax=Acetobacteroides hydrogenigenes TaxID=979970 RepID=A0A4R2EJM5_9BACT|nr:site-specific tyrosine recombinase XerD [Acetobacteroides hydrogenigenes]TCN68525.1 integrase/recombinase XerD [Acetobacteroides hydrogenigenes]
MEWINYKTDYLNFLRLEKSLSENSLMAYERDFNKLSSFVEKNYPKLPPTAVSQQHLEEFLASLYDDGLNARSQARVLSSIKGFYKFLMLEDEIEEDPTELIQGPKLDRKLPHVLSVEEIDLLINAIDLSKLEGSRNRAILETLYSCGLRVSEAINLRLSDLFFKEEYIRIIGKGDKERLVPINQKAIGYIEKYLVDRSRLNINPKSENILFLNRRGNQLTRVMVFTIIKDLSRKVGLNKKISPHTFRHSFASHLFERGADLKVIQELLGHETIITTEIYTHLEKEHLREVLLMHHPRAVAP